MENTKTILFDFDGVIVDSFRISFEISKKIDQIVFSEDEYRKLFEGNIYDAFPGDENTNTVDGPYFKVYIPELFKLPVIEGISEALEVLSRLYRLIVVSSTISSPIKEWLVNHNLARYFVEIMGGDVHRSKVEKIKIVFKKYAIGPENCVFITDTLGDLREARKAGVNSLAVTYGFHEESRLQKGNPAGFIRSPHDMVKVIENYWGKY